MRRITTGMGVGLLGAVLLVGWGALGRAGERQATPVHQYTGQVRSIKIDRCGLQPGTCEGSIVLKLQGGQEVALAILPGTWIQRGDQLFRLSVGCFFCRHDTPPCPWRECAAPLSRSRTRAFL